MTLTDQAPATTPRLGALTGYDDPVARSRLRRMKAVATGLLGVAAALFLLTFALPDTTATGYLRAAAEAGMIGGFADWFAVTALFRHPLGLRIPHTALVPRKKDELATKLGEFVAGNFLTPEAVAGHVADFRPVQRLGERLADPVFAQRVARELAVPLRDAVAATDPADVAGLVLGVVRADLARRELDGRSWAPVAGRLLRAEVTGAGRQPVTDWLVTQVLGYVAQHRTELHDQLYDFAESRGMLGWLVTTHKRVDKALDFAEATLREMQATGRGHPVRRRLDELLLQIADRWCEDPEAAAVVDEQLRDWAHAPWLAGWIQEMAARLLDTAGSSLAEPSGDLERQLARWTGELGARISSDERFAARLEAGLDAGVRYAVEHYGDQLVRLIRIQVAAWDGRTAADLIETAAGRDLQFIRINGTVVGALAGVAIHTVAVAAGKG